MSAVRPFHLLGRRTAFAVVLRTVTAQSALPIPSSPPHARRHLVTAARHHGPHGLSNLREHYHHTLQQDLLILTYDHTRVRESPVFRSATVQALVDAREENELSDHNNDSPPLKDTDSFDHNSDLPSREEDESSDHNSDPPPPFEAESPLPTKRKGNKPLKPRVPPPSPKTVPRLESITVHAMVKEAITSKSNLLSAFMALQSVTAERPEVVYARTSVAPWKLREGMPIGVKVTLRGDSMYNFLDKLTGIVLPGLKEWHGLPSSAGDGNGNVAIGLPPSALSLFPEIEGAFDMYPRMTGFDVVFNTTAFTNTEGRLLMSGFSVPFTQDGRLGKKGSRK